MANANVTQLPSVFDWEDASFSKNFFASLSSSRERNIYTDVTLKADGQEIRCHRVILSAASEYFNAMFAQGFEEARSDSIEIQDVDSETLRRIINYIYTGKIQITTENVQNLTKASDMFQLHDLTGACENFMILRVEPSNCIGLYTFSKLLNLQFLQEETRSVMLTKFNKVVESCEFLQLDVEGLIEYIKDVDLDVSSEDLVFEAVTLWLNHDPETRRAVTDRIMTYVKFPYCTSDYLQRVVKVNEFMNTDLCKKLVEEACAFNTSSGHTRERRENFQTCPRKSATRRLVIVEKEGPLCWYLKEETSTWEELTRLPDFKSGGHSVCGVYNGILITGGSFQNVVKRDCWLFHTDTKLWEQIPPLAIARVFHETVLLGGKVYAIGGMIDSDQESLKSVEMMDTQTHQWFDAAPLPLPLYDPVVVSSGMNIFVFHGWREKTLGDLSTKSTPCIQMYSSVSQDWHLKASVPGGCGVVAAVALNRKIYAATDKSRVHPGKLLSYDLRTDAWTCLELNSKIRGGAAWKGRVLFVRGKLFERISLEEYDPVTNNWTVWPDRLKRNFSFIDLVVVNV